MPRTYKRKPGSSRYVAYSTENLNAGLNDVKGGLTVFKASVEWGY